LLLEIENLHTAYRTKKGLIKAVDGVSLSIGENEVFGLAGESGCGKSTLIRTLLRLVPGSARVGADRMCFRGEDLLGMSARDFRRRVLWSGISLVPQSAMNALNPVYRVGNQLLEALQAHEQCGEEESRRRVEALFDLVGLQPELTGSYPHELSGGMRQRAMIAMSLVLGPDLVIMDEPTTGLDVLVQERILRKFKEIRSEWQERKGGAASVLLITHDISVIAEMSDRIGIMYAGRLMETGPAEALFREPHHPYTLGLMNAFPSLRDLDRELISIAGSPPGLLDAPPGCPFSPRCPFAETECDDGRPPLEPVGPNHLAACRRYDRAEEFRLLAREKKTWQFSR
jgi:peptide/nickel transport system ATP-binding protein